MKYTKEIEIGGRTLSIETGIYAKQANGAVMVRYGDTMVLVTAVASDEPREDIDFFPLSVEYRERSFAAGKFPGGFIKREGRPSEKEVLSSRLIDRPIRPLFPDTYKNDTQIAAFVYSFDGENDADVLGAVGASAALVVSDLPFLEPIAQVRVGKLNGELVINPTHQQIEESEMELTVAGTENSIMMVEGESSEISEEELVEALKFAQEEIKKIIGIQNELREECGLPKMEVPEAEVDEELKSECDSLARDKYAELINSGLSKDERKKKNKEIVDSVLEALEEKYPEREGEIKSFLHDIEKELMRKQIIEDGKRLDGRGLKDIRQITTDVGFLPRTHGSSLFTRGETQSLTTLTLGTKDDEQIVDGLQMEYSKRFLLHYNFPPFCVGETGRYFGPGRREIGHGNLAERALKRVIPDEEKFPYTLRLNSDILESNGSSSMATVCAGSLAMMDGGVPVKCGIAGIAMGLIKEGEETAVLSDILGDEDHLGDMDFKVAGSREGITAVQMDIKIQGISYEIMEKALAQAKEGRIFILDRMEESIKEPRESISKYAPTLLVYKIDPEKIGTVIGSAGKVIQGIQTKYNVEIYIDDDGSVNISGPDKESVNEAKEYIKNLTADPEIGKIYKGKVVKTTDFGAFVEILPGIQGLLHISQIDNQRINKVTDVLKEGDEVPVKLLKVENGKMSLSRKAALNDQKKNQEEKKEEEKEDK
jgi:polyribonucleotide nucleotidyltransferase